MSRTLIVEQEPFIKCWVSIYTCIKLSCGGFLVCYYLRLISGFSLGFRHTGDVRNLMWTTFKKMLNSNVLLYLCDKLARTLPTAALCLNVYNFIIILIKGIWCITDEIFISGCFQWVLPNNILEWARVSTLLDCPSYSVLQRGERAKLWLTSFLVSKAN